MSFEMVPAISIAGMVVCAVMSISIPILLAVYGLKKLNAKASSLIIGAVTFIVAALVLESIVNNLVFVAFGTAIRSKVWLLALYGGLAAAIFEETGRFISLKFIMKKQLSYENALVYGIGHGGIEAVCITGLGMISTIANSILINTGAMGDILSAQTAGLDSATADAAIAQIQAIATQSPLYYWLGGFERISAIMLHIGMSIIIFCGIKYAKRYLVALAYLIHFVVDFLTVICGNSLHIILTELILLALGVSFLLLGRFIYKKLEAAA